MMVARRGIVSVRRKLLGGVLADRLEQAVAHPLVASFDLDHRLLHQPGQRVQHVVAPERWKGTDLFHGGGVNRAGEHRHAIQKALLRAGKKSIAPNGGTSYRCSASTFRRSRLVPMTVSCGQPMSR